MKYQALALTLMLVMAPAMPAAAADAPMKAAASPAATDDEVAMARLKARIAKAKELWGQLKALKGLTGEAAKAQIAKVKLGLKDLKAEGKAGSNMILSGMIRKIEAELDRLDPVKKGDK